MTLPCSKGEDMNSKIIIHNEEEYSTCKLVMKKPDDVVLAGDMKVKQNKVG